jgi:predicted enzyme related to lactoylglutathione lyase
MQGESYYGKVTLINYFIFEIPADDIERSKKFYNDLFRCKIQNWRGVDSGNSSHSHME